MEERRINVGRRDRGPDEGSFKWVSGLVRGLCMGE